MLPSLVHPVRIGYRQIDVANTPGVDPQSREPTGKPVYLTEVTITAQLGLGKTRGFRQRAGGDDPESDGHIILRADLLLREVPGIVLHKGDRVVRLYTGQPTETVVAWHVIEVRPAMHYEGVPRGWKVFYRDLKTQARVA